METFFSVVIPIYNRKNFFRICVDSVLNQSYQNFEIFIIDDGSDDGTIALMSEYINKGINYIRISENKGVSYARNLGISLAKGKYLAFLDSDDKWDKKKLEISYNYISKFPDFKIFHSEEKWIKAGKELKQKKKHKKPEGFIYEDCLKLCCIGMSTSVVDSKLFEEIGVFDENLQACEDYDFWLRACYENKVKLIPEALTIKDGGRKDQLSNQPGLDKYRAYSLEKMIKSNMLNKEDELKTRTELIKKCSIYLNGAIKRGKTEESEYYEKLINKYQL